MAERARLVSPSASTCGAELLGIHSPAWQGFLATHAGATIFHHPAWAGLLAACYGYRPLAAAIRQHDGRLGALLPTMEVRGPFGNRRWVSLPFTDACPPLVTDAASGQALPHALLALQSRSGIARWQVRGPVSHPAFTMQATAVRHTLDLTPPLGKIEAACSKMHQRNIRRAAKAGVRTAFDDSAQGMETYYRLHVMTRRRQGVPTQSRRFFRLLWERLIRTGLGTVLLAYNGSACVAGAVFLGWNGTLIYKYGASDLAFAEQRPNNALFWAAIQWAHAEGYHTLDWGRTDLDNHGLRAFKDGWGAREELLVYSTAGVARPAGRLGGLGPAAGRALATLIRRSPPLLCRAVGEILYRYAA